MTVDSLLALVVSLEDLTQTRESQAFAAGARAVLELLADE